MTKKVFASFLLALLLCIPSAYGYNEYTLQQLLGISKDHGLVIGDKIFYNFSFLIATQPTDCSGCTWGPTSPSQITVTPLDSNPFLPGLKFSGSIFVDFTNPQANVPNFATLDLNIGYWVTTVNAQPLITDIHQTISAGARGPGSNIVVTENAYYPAGSSNVVGNSTVSFLPSDLSDPPVEAGDNIYLTGGPYTTISVLKDVRVTAFNGGFADVTILEQRISQVPEPGFYGALALGLSGLVLAFRRRSAAK